MASSSRDVGSRIGGGLRIVGRVTSEGSLVVAGIVEGDVHVASTLEIAAGARVTGAVEATSVRVDGTVFGPVTAHEAIAVGPQARMQGDLAAVTLRIESGARVNGTVRRIAPAPAPDNEKDDVPVEVAVDAAAGAAADGPAASTVAPPVPDEDEPASVDTTGAWHAPGAVDDDDATPASTESDDDAIDAESATERLVIPTRATGVVTASADDADADAASGASEGDELDEDDLTDADDEPADDEAGPAVESVAAAPRAAEDGAGGMARPAGGGVRRGDRKARRR